MTDRMLSEQLTGCVGMRTLLTIKHSSMTVCPPIGKHKKYPHRTLQIVHAEEINPPEGRAPIF
jgi:hypothetical protein